MTVESLPASVGVADSAGYEPEVSVIVPVLNEAGTVGELSERVAEIRSGEYAEEFAKIKAMPETELRQMYNTRDIEPD